jgi:hypothetical protein
VAPAAELSDCGAEASLFFALVHVQLLQANNPLHFHIVRLNGFVQQLKQEKAEKEKRKRKLCLAA